MQYTIPYILLISVYGLMAIISHQNADNESLCKRINYIGIGIFVFYFGFRGFVMHDWYNYYPEFEKVEFTNISAYDITQDREIGWTLFMVVCKTIWDNYHFMIFVHTVICVALLYRFFKRYTDNLALGLMIYLAFEGFVISTNLLRNAFSLLIFINAIPYILERKMLKYMGMCLLACLFHYSSIVFFPCYFFLHLKTNKWVFAAIFLIFLFIFLKGVPILIMLVRLSGIGGELVEKKIEMYTEMGHQLKISLGLLERIMTAGLFFCYYDKIRELRKENQIFLNIFLVYSFSAFVLSDFSELSKRSCTLFMSGYWILWMELLKCFYYKNNKILFCCFMWFYCAIKAAIPAMNNPIYEYENILFGASSYQERKFMFEKNNVDDD